MLLTQLFKDFFKSEKAGGIILIFVTAISLILSNSIIQGEYKQMWNYHLGEHNVTEWINDALMTIFFLLIGLELEREIYTGELSNIRNASLPIIGAVGGMVVPALIYFVINLKGGNTSGSGIPMATDIAFALGILSLLGKRVPASLKVFLTALAVIDDLGAIIVIAIFYTNTLVMFNLLISLGIFTVLLVLNRLKVNHLAPYLIGGAFMWYFMLHSGIHATITGVLLAFAIPFRRGGKDSPSYILQHYIHKPVAFFVLPLFALANTCMSIGGDWYNNLGDLSSLGILAGLVLGKPIGICLFALFGVWLNMCKLPKGVDFKQLIGTGLLGGIGFTMSIFITLLAFNDPTLINNAKMAILIASCLAALAGFVWLKLFLPKQLPVELLEHTE